VIRFFRKLDWLARRRQKEKELREELQFHLDEEGGEQQAEGLTEQEARWVARRDFGNVARVQEDTRVAWGWMMLEQLSQDLRYAFRTIAANRLFSVLAILSLALGIGANTAIYSFMDSILLRSLPVPDPESLVLLNWHTQPRSPFRGPPPVVQGLEGPIYTDPKLGTVSGVFPFPAFELFQKNTAVSSVFAYCQAGQRSLTIQGQADIASGEYVSGNYFQDLNVAPATGRLIVSDDDRPGAPAVAVLSYAFSQRRFGGPGGAAGQSVLINNIPFVVVGVTPPEFFGVDPAAAPDFYVPMHANASPASGGSSAPATIYLDSHLYWVEIMGRLHPGISLPQARAALAPLFQQWVASTASNYRERANLPALVVKEGAGGLESLRRQYSKPLYVLMALVGPMLAIACGNVASLLLARGASRRREMAIRLSVGAGRLRVVRQLLTESVLLASIGGVLGVLLAIWGIRFLTLLLANGRTNFTLHASLNWHVLAVAAGLSLLTGALFGLAPALESTRVDVLSAMKEIQAGRPTGLRLRRVLVVGQIAVSLLMLVAAGLFIRTLTNLQSIELGFNRENLLLFQMNARQAGHKDPEIAAFYADLQKRFSAIPGVRGASLSRSSLIEAGMATRIGLPGAPPHPTVVLPVGPAFFKTMQIPLLAGREINEQEQPGSLAVAVVNETFAEANFGNRNPIGQHIAIWNRGTSREAQVVGVSRNARDGGVKQSFRPVVYVPYNQGGLPLDKIVYALRTAGDPLSYVNTVREIVHRADAHVPLSKIQTEAAEIDQTINQEIVFAKLCTAFAILALVIACVGLYGTISYDVARRTGEIGIRMALGAQRGRVVRMVLREGLRLAAGGLAIGMATALGASKFVGSFLYGMKPNDPLTLILAVTTLLAAALLAGYLPAHKASRIDPMTALRHE
jgi:macrolide transport system ATP-binding/permease protein